MTSYLSFIREGHPNYSCPKLAYMFSWAEGSKMEICRSSTDLWEAWLRLGVVLQDAAVGSWIQQGGVVVSGRTADAFWPFSLKQHINVLHSWREDEQSVHEWNYSKVQWKLVSRKILACIYSLISGHLTSLRTIFTLLLALFWSQPNSWKKYMSL